MTQTQVIQIDLATAKSHKTQQPPKALSLVHADKLDGPISPVKLIVTPATEAHAPMEVCKQAATAEVPTKETPVVADTKPTLAVSESKFPPCPIALLRATHLLALQSTIIRMKKERADYRLGWSVYRCYSEMIEELELEADGVRRAQEDLDRFPSVFTPIVLKTMSGPKTRHECEADDVKRLAALHLWIRPIKNGPLTKQQARDYEQARKMLKQIPAGIEDSWTFMYEMEMRRHMEGPGKPPFGLQPKKPRVYGPMNLDQALRHHPVIRDMPYGPITKEVAMILGRMFPREVMVEIPARFALLKFPIAEEKSQHSKSRCGKSRKEGSKREVKRETPVEGKGDVEGKAASVASTSSEVDVDFLKDLQSSPADRPAPMNPAKLPSHLPKKPLYDQVADDKTDDGLSWLQVPYSAYPSVIGKELRAIRHADGLSWLKMPYREYGREVEAKLRKVHRKMERIDVKAVV